jgi:ribosomal protein L37E
MSAARNASSLIDTVNDGAMKAPQEIDCPNCGKTNEYSLGSCRKCGLPREEFYRNNRDKMLVKAV